MPSSLLHSKGARDLADFVLTRGMQGDDPHPLFDVGHYLSQRPDLVPEVRAGLNPLVHYLEHGAAEGVDPHPLFITQFYVEQCAGLDEALVSPLAHFLMEGWRMGLDPHPIFSVNDYLLGHPEVARSGVNPLLHCLRLPAAEQGYISRWFDGRYYLANNLDIAASDWAPFDHFVRHGIAEGRAGSGYAAHMLATNPTFTRPLGLRDLAWETHRRTLWARSPGRLHPRQVEAAAQEIAGFTYRPSVSLLMHATADDGTKLPETLATLAEQTYRQLQICVSVDRDAPDTLMRALAAAGEGGGPQIAVVRRGWNGDPAFALNAALDMAQGEFAGVIAPGDSLHRHALAILVGRMQGRGTCDVAYGDEDTVDGDSVHSDPVLKLGWSPEALLGCDYLSRLGLFRTWMLRDVGGFRPGFDTGCVHDLVLRATCGLSAKSVRHAPKIVYHRLALPAASINAPRQDGIHRAIAAFLDAEGARAAIVRAAPRDSFRVSLSNCTDPLVSIVIPTGNATFVGPLGREWVLTNCIRGILAGSAYKAVEIVVVHDGNLTAEQQGEFDRPEIRLVRYRDPIFNFSKKINMGVAASTGSYVLLLNDDVVPKRPDWLNVMLGFAERPGVGVVGAKLFFPDGRLQHTGIIVQGGMPGHLYYRADGCEAGTNGMNIVARNCLAVTGACQLMTRANFDLVKGYDEALPLNYNDVDICLRLIDRGLRVVYAAGSELYHFEGVTKELLVGDRLTLPSETELFQARWRVRYAQDPFYHPDHPIDRPLGWEPADGVRRTASQARKLPGEKCARTKGVNFFGAANRASGLGTASRSYVSSLQAAGLATRIVDLDKLYGHQTIVDHALPSVPQDFPISLVLANADATPATFANYADDLQRATYRIAMWVWELPAIRPEWMGMIEKYDEIWVPSQFCHDAFKPMTKKPVTIVPYSLGRLPEFSKEEAQAVRKEFGIPANSFVFLFMFDTYSFVDRKNPTCLLDAFEAEFRNAKAVTLVLKISYFNNLQSEYSKGNSAFRTRLDCFLSRCRNVVIISESLAERDVYRLLDCIDCYVSPHRAEGFGLTIAEAMYYRKPVISTDFSGTRDLVQDGVGLKLGYRMTEIAESVGPYAQGNIWADADPDHLRTLMRQVCDDRPASQVLGAAAHDFIVERFSPSIIGSIARKRLREVADAI
jgi:glycosyltransferase involved in cell wall biosynthesis